MKKPLKPTGPYHDFWLLNTAENPYDASPYFKARKDAPVRLEDDVLRYFSDSLNWLSTSSIERVKGKNLNYFGLTIINSEGSKLFSKLTKNWADLLKLGPKEIVITGSYEVQLDENEQPIDNGDYQKIKINQSELVSKLEKLKEFADVVSKGEHYILHSGI